VVAAVRRVVVESQRRNDVNHIMHDFAVEMHDLFVDGGAGTKKAREAFGVHVLETAILFVTLLKRKSVDCHGCNPSARIYLSVCM